MGHRAPRCLTTCYSGYIYGDGYGFKKKLYWWIEAEICLPHVDMPHAVSLWPKRTKTDHPECQCKVLDSLGVGHWSFLPLHMNWDHHSPWGCWPLGRAILSPSLDLQLVNWANIKADPTSVLVLMCCVCDGHLLLNQSIWQRWWMSALMTLYVYVVSSST